MASAQTPDPLLDEAHAAFIQRGVSINVASRNAHNVPSLMRALGCRVAEDRRRVTVYLPTLAAQTLLADIRATRAITAVFSCPSTYQTLQLKGTDAAVEQLTPNDRAQIAAYCDSFIRDLRGIGYTEDFARCVIPNSETELAAVCFTPSAAFEQTPGPAAGQQLRR